MYHDTQTILPYEDLKLHFAALNGQSATLKTLINQGANVNVRDVYYSTPLHLSAINGHAECVKILLEAGAKVDPVSYFGITPLLLAVKYRHIEVIKSLLTAGANPNAPLEGEISPFKFNINAIQNEFSYFPEEKDPHHIEQFNQNLDIFKLLADPTIGDPFIRNLGTMLSENGSPLQEDIPAAVYLNLLANLPSDETIKAKMQSIISDISQSHYTETYLDTKNLLHTFEGSGQYQIQLDNTTINLMAEGFYGFYSTLFASASIARFLNFSPKQSLQYQLFTHVYESLVNAHHHLNSISNDSNIQLIVDDISQGKTIILPTGWLGHFITLTFSNHHLIVANSGQKFDLKPNGSLIYKINNFDAIDLTLIKNILTNQDQMDLEYDLHYKLGLELVGILETPDQIVGNCSWQSYLPTVEALLFSHLIDLGTEPTSAKSLASNYFLEWEHFHKLSTLTDYLEHYPDTQFEMLVDILMHEVHDPSEEAIIRSALITEHLANHHSEQFSEFVTNQPVGWLGLSSALELAEIDINSGKLQNIHNQNDSNNIKISDLLDLIKDFDLNKLLNHLSNNENNSVKIDTSEVVEYHNHLSEKAVIPTWITDTLPPLIDNEFNL